MYTMQDNRKNKNVKFIKLAESRTNKIIDAIINLSKLSNRQNYEYDNEEVNQIFTRLRKEITDTEAMFKINNKKNSDFQFKLTKPKI